MKVPAQMKYLLQTVVVGIICSNQDVRHKIDITLMFFDILVRYAMYLWLREVVRSFMSGYGGNSRQFEILE